MTERKIVWCLCALIAIASWAGIGYVVIHFVRKFW